MGKEVLIKNYAANDRTWEAATATPSEKAAAWRQQSLILQYLTRDSSPQVRYGFLEDHFNKLESQTAEAYVNERIESVASMLGSTALKQPEKDMDWPDMEGHLFESECHSKYVSCCQLEVTSEQLRMLREAAESIREGRQGEEKSNSGISSNNTKAMEPHNKRSVPRTMINFLQPKRPALEDAEQTAEPTGGQQAKSESKEGTSPTRTSNEFRTAREEWIIQSVRNKRTPGGGNNSAKPYEPHQVASNGNNSVFTAYGMNKRSLGGRRGVHSHFVPPIAQPESSKAEDTRTKTPSAQAPEDEKLANIDPKMIELIRSEIMHKYTPVDWNDIVGLEYAKTIIKEAVVYPLLRPDIFTGLLRPPRGILLFGPPGTGKTLIGKCIASQSKATFFSITASTLTSKWVGDSEKMVRALFAVAAAHQPAVVFIDEIDSLLSKRSETDHESSRRLKNEFLIHLDGANTSDEERILIVGATNRPQELDDAARRRLVKRLYVPLPEFEARQQLLKNLLECVRHELCPYDLQEIARLTEGYSGADMKSLCSEASMAAIRSVPMDQLMHIDKNKLRAINMEDFRLALAKIRPSVSPNDLQQYVEWNSSYGCSQ